MLTLKLENFDAKNGTICLNAFFHVSLDHLRNYFLDTSTAYTQAYWLLRESDLASISTEEVIDTNMMKFFRNWKKTLAQMHITVSMHEVCTEYTIAITNCKNITEFLVRTKDIMLSHGLIEEAHWQAFESEFEIPPTAQFAIINALPLDMLANIIRFFSWKEIFITEHIDKNFSRTSSDRFKVLLKNQFPQAYQELENSSLELKQNSDDKSSVDDARLATITQNYKNKFYQCAVQDYDNPNLATQYNVEPALANKHNLDSRIRFMSAKEGYSGCGSHTPVYGLWVARDNYNRTTVDYAYQNGRQDFLDHYYRLIKSALTDKYTHKLKHTTFHSLYLLHWAFYLNQSIENEIKPLLENKDNKINLKTNFQHERVFLYSQPEVDCTPLHLVARVGNITLYNFLKKQVGFDVNAQNSNGETALHLAANRGFTELVKLLLEDKNINIELKKSNGFTALQIACEIGNLNIVKMLCEHDRSVIETAIIIAICNQHKDIWHYLLIFSAEINFNFPLSNDITVTRNNQTVPIHTLKELISYARMQEYEETISKLLNELNTFTTLTSFSKAVLLKQQLQALQEPQEFKEPTDFNDAILKIKNSIEVTIQETENINMKQNSIWVNPSSNLKTILESYLKIITDMQAPQQIIDYTCCTM